MRVHSAVAIGRNTPTAGGAEGEADDGGDGQHNGPSDGRGHGEAFVGVSCDGKVGAAGEGGGGLVDECCGLRLW